MANQSSGAQSFAMASRFLYAFQKLSKVLTSNQASSGFEDLNVSQIRILLLVHDEPGLRANDVIKRLDLPLETGKSLILGMEKKGLLALDRSTPELSPSLRLGGQSQRVAFQVKATQLSILAELLDKLPEANRLAMVEALEQLAEQ
jgi:DNA-binding MarR family transcriptional regulator